MHLIGSSLALKSLLLLIASVTATPVDIVAKDLEKRDSLYGCYNTNLGFTNKTEWAYQSNGWCNDYCQPWGASTFALYDAAYCFCGNTLPPKANKVDSSKCDTPCQGWPEDACGGGTDYYSVWLTGTVANPPIYAAEAETTAAAGASTATGTKAGDTDTASKTNAAHVVAETTVDADGNTVVVTAAATTSAAPAAATETELTPLEQAALNKSKHITASIAASCVLGLVGLSAVAGAVFLWCLSRKSKNRGFRDVPDYNRGSQIPDMSSRFEDYNRRQSNGSIDDKDFSRQILQVSNPDR